MDPNGALHPRRLRVLVPQTPPPSLRRLVRSPHVAFCRTEQTTDVHDRGRPSRLAAIAATHAFEAHLIDGSHPGRWKLRRAFGCGAVAVLVGCVPAPGIRSASAGCNVIPGTTQTFRASETTV